ncbi:unnamed protein product [Prunus armeniaca]|uniref:Uncharacterized protein n=1 Tax=Prunus armeniaca TaxID=36596 RepID=A0A6J5VPR3_PRUAR|nr:unnamed protein product [Prunus armeniaca]
MRPTLSSTDNDALQRPFLRFDVIIESKIINDHETESGGGGGSNGCYSRGGYGGVGYEVAALATEVAVIVKAVGIASR